MSRNNITEIYIETLFKKRNLFIEEMEEYAEVNGIPIMEQTGIQLLLQFLEIHQPKRILEIGTAIGYSAIRMAEVVPHAKIVTVERDEDRASRAKENILRSGHADRIILLEGDALNLKEMVAEHAPFDALFIDAAKGQYEKFFDFYEPLVLPGGLVISDNVLFKGMVSGEVIPGSKNVENLVKKLRNYNELRMKDNRFSSMIYPVGDGVMISVKRK